MSEEVKEKVKVPKRIIAARLAIFAATAAWVLGWLGLGLFLHPVLFDTGGIIYRLGGNIVDAMNTWYVITFILVGIYVAVRGFRFVGKWEKE